MVSRRANFGERSEASRLQMGRQIAISGGGGGGGALSNVSPLAKCPNPSDFQNESKFKILH